MSAEAKAVVAGVSTLAAQTSPQTATDATNTIKKEPPPETLDSIKTRRFILASFWTIVVLIGLPIWIYTTTVPRATLPLDVMNQWATGEACQFEFPLHVALEADRPEDNQELARLVQTSLDGNGASTMYHLQVAPGGTLDRTPAVTVKLTSDPAEKGVKVTAQRYDPILDIHHAPTTNTGLAPLANTVAAELRKTFQEEQSLLTHLLLNAGRQVPNMQRSQETLDLMNQRSMRTFKYAPTYHITFSLFSGDASPAAWEIKTALDEYLQPLLSSFSAISSFTVDTQVQLYASLPPSMQGPTLDEKTRQWTLEKSDLSGFINAAEWPLSPSIGAGPTINFVLYVPSEKQRPLTLKENGGTSWLIPQWGGVQILNPTSAQIKRGSLNKDDLQSVVLTFAEQLVTLLGLPKTPSSLPIQLGALTRERAASLILSASSTLGALSRLTLKLTSIAIPDSVAQSVDKTISHLDHACKDLRNARYSSALKHARTAEAEAEQAFFEPSMVGQVYFPDEHKVAVYVPMLGPMAVPLIMALLKELKKLRQK
ncbi:GPI transamidase component PIG-S-like protein [Elsinoe fawcettii]|nr:GPI transamidase component PIG-S-like protein [Elsinoe fawcettii]